MSNIPKDLRYTKEHEWCRLTGNTAVVGITFHAQEKLGDIVYLELPKAGGPVAKDATFGVVESVKAVSDLYSPVTGTITEVNEAMLDTPGGLNEDPYTNGWLIKVLVANAAEVEALMDAAQYEEFVEHAG